MSSSDSWSITDIFTDTSNFGLGADIKMFGSTITFWLNFHHLLFTHINYKEALCFVFALIDCGPPLQNKKVIIHFSSTTVAAITNKDAAKNPLILHCVKRLFWCSATYNFFLHAVYISGHYHALADHASCMDDPTHFLAF